MAAKKIHYKALDTDEYVPLCRSKSKDPLLTNVPENVTCSTCQEDLPA